MSWGLRNHVLLSFLGSIFCKWPVINVTIHTLNIEVHKIQDIGYFSTVLIQLFELDMFELDININCGHLWDVFQLVRVTCVTFLKKLQINTFYIAY